jgi:multidrug efflux pump subunit AcrB
MSPAHDQGYFSFKVTAPVGSTLDYTDGIMRQIEAQLAKRDEVQGQIVMAGVNGDVNLGLGFVTLKPRDQRKLAQQESMDALRAEFQKHPFPGTRVTFADSSQAGFGTAQRAAPSLDFSIRGPDWQTLGKLAKVFAEEMQRSGVFVDIDNGFTEGMPEVQIIPSREKALAHNVEMKGLSDTITALVGGARVATYKENGRRYDVRLRLLKDDRARPEDIGELFVRATDGKLVRISELAEIRIAPSLQTITRQNRQRSIMLSANPAPGKYQDDALRTVHQIAENVLPDGYTYELGPGSKAATEARDGLLFALVLGLIVAYMILASQFNSFLHPITILLALPFSITGSLLALWLGGLSLNVYSMIGVILLMGIVKKNSILLVDYTNQVRQTGKDCDAALLEACPVRLRPILMTSVATIAGALPAAFALGPGSELRIPMAVAIIGGLGVSTVLTLIIVPCFYSLMDQLTIQLRSLWRRPLEAPHVPLLEQEEKSKTVLPPTSRTLGQPLAE